MEIYFSESTGLYFYSALLQANAAIIAVIGIYIIFQIQGAQSTITSLRSFFMVGNPNIRSMGLEFDSKTLSQKKIEVRDNDTNTPEKLALLKWYLNEKRARDLKRKIITPTILFLIALSTDCICLFFSSTIHSVYIDREIIIASINLLYELFLLIYISSFIIKIMKFEIEESENL